jgi:hypothetical protein
MEILGQLLFAALITVFCTLCFLERCRELSELESGSDYSPLAGPTVFLIASMPDFQLLYLHGFSDFRTRRETEREVPYNR